jgi:hypothetical protein
MPSVREPPPRPENVFVMSQPADMLAKLSWENAQFQKIMSSQHYQPGAMIFAGYQAFNCALTAWHCADWAWGYADEEAKQHLARRYSLPLKKSDRTNREAFFDAVCAESRDLEICRHIANSSKHLKLDRSDDRGFRALAADTVYRSSPDKKLIDIFELLVIDRDQPVRLADVFSRALAYWGALYGSPDLLYVEDRFIDAS